MVQTLFHQDAYLTDFQAVVTACRAQEDAYWIALDNTAFYDTSGGQPNDTGTLDQALVLDVIKENGVIWHRTDRPLAVGAAVQGHVDWPRRFDHMCQHAADHMIAGMLWQKYGATTIGPVSYTHLDVYKRQNQPCAACLPCASCSFAYSPPNASS